MKKRQRSFKCIIAMLLIFSMIITFGPSTIIANADTSSSGEITRLTNEEKQGVILHAWDWSFNNIKNNVQAIKDAGYTAIQVSPVEPSKNDDYKTNSLWYILYQPISFTVGNAQLGNEEKFKDMCTAAHNAGLKIIVDVVSNHTGNNEGDGNKTIAPQVTFQGVGYEDYWHLPLHAVTDWNDRYEVTHGGLGLPDLNTSNTKVQAMIRKFLQECLTDGADGFRFDTAKHIELPSPLDEDGTCSYYWPNVLSGLKTNKETTPFVYGEDLQGGADNFANYTKLMDVTASNYGDAVRSIVGVGSSSENLSDTNFDNYKTYNVPNGVKPSSLVTWVESHDTYANDGGASENMTDEQIKLGWALTAPRAGSTPLFFNRPAGRNKLQGNIGDVGNSNWKDPDVIAVNKFHNAMESFDENVTKISDKVIMIERVDQGVTKGVVIVNLGDVVTDFSANATLSTGSYTNCSPNGGTFTSNGTILSGSLPKGVTVLYEGGSQEVVVNFPQVAIDKENCSFYDTLKLTLNVTNSASASYSINGGKETPYYNGDKITIGDGIAVGDQVKVDLKANNSNGKAVEEYLYTKKDINSVATVYFKKPAGEGWQIPYAYVYNTLGEKYNDAAFPGTKMIKVGDDLYKLNISGFTDGQVMFNDWFYGNHKTSALVTSASGMKLYDTDKTWKDITEVPIENSNVTPDEVTGGTSKVYFQKPNTSEWNYDDVSVYFYGKGGPSWPGVPMTKVEGSTNLYTYTLPAGLEDSNVIFNANGGKMQVPGHNESGLTAPANSKMIYVDGAWKEYVEAGTSKIYFRKPKDWAEPNVYAYKIDGNVDSKVTADVNAWPGVPMVKVDGIETLYSYTFSKDCQNINVIFNDKVKDKDGGNQLPDKDAYQLFAGEAKIYDNGSLRNFTADDLKEPEAPAVASQGVTKVYFKNTDNWDSVKIHYWPEGGSGTTWPGVSMVDEGNNVYSFNLPKGYESANVIFNNNGKGKQTVNLSTKVGSTMEFVSNGLDDKGNLAGELVSKSKVYFRNTNGWKSVKVHYWNEGGKGTTWPGVSVVDEGYNLYSYTLPDEYANANVIFNNDNNGKQTNGVKAAEGKTLILDGDTWRDFTADDIPKENSEDPDKPSQNKEVSKVYFKNIQGWGEPYVHYWKDGGEQTKWPGMKMQDEGNGLYSYSLPQGYGDANVILNAQTSATENDRSQLPKDGGFKLVSGSTMIYEDGEWKDYKSNDGKKEVSKIPTVSGLIYPTTTNIRGTAGKDADIILSVDEITQTTTSAGAKVDVISKTEEKEIGYTKADNDGNWSVNIPAQKVEAVIKVIAREEGKLESSIIVTVINKSSSESSSSSSSSSNSRSHSGSNSSSSSSKKEQTVTKEGNTTTINSTDATTIEKEILNSTTPNIKVDLSSHPIVYKGIFEALASNPSKNLTLVGDNASWTFNGTDILANGAIDIDTTIKSTSQNATMINNLVSGQKIVNLSFAHKGVLPGKAKIQASVDSKYNNKIMNMYSYSLENNRLELVSANVAVKDEIATFEITKGSDYILSETVIPGTVKEGWNQITNGNWIFVKEENNVNGWIKDGTNWYLFNKSGIMKTGWAKDSDGKWYYLNTSGAMKTGWLNDNGTWYYLNESGAMLSNTSVGGYNLGVDGAWNE